MMSPHDFESLIDALFPFHFEVDHDLTVTRLGPRLSERFESMQTGVPAADLLTFQRPLIDWDLERLRAEQGSLVVLTPLAEGVSFSGQFLELESRSSMIFFGAPWVSSLADLSAANLQLNDFPPNDPRGDLVMHAQSAEMMMQDLAETNRRMLESEEQNRSMQKQLDRLTHVEVASQVSGGLAHKFNNLLAIVNGQLEMAIKLLGRGESEAAMSSLTRSLETSQEAAELIGELQNLTKDRRVKPDNVDIVEVVKRVRNLMSPVLGSGIDWRIDAPSGEALLAVCDPRALHDVLVSLAINAAEAMGGSGQITTTVDRREVTTPVGSASPGSVVSLRFEDNGPGFSAEATQRAFEPFFSTKGEAHSGLGLATAERLVTLNGGQISIVSDSSSGGRVDLVLPAGEATVTAESLRVLLVDDDEKVLELFGELLRLEGFDVTSFNNPQEALATTRERWEYDLIVSDVRMPQISGPQMVREIEEAHGSVPTVFATGYAEGAFAEDDSPLDPTHKLLKKPFPLHTLVAAIHEVMDAAGAQS